MVFVAFLLEATPGELDEIIVGLRKERRAARLAMRKAGAK